MSRTDRWLTTIAITASASPLLLITLIIKLLPIDVPVVDFSIVDADPGSGNPYDNLMAGLFCIVPLSIVYITRFIKSRDNTANITSMLAVSIMLSFVFSAVVLYGGLRQFNYVQVTQEFDFIGFICVLVCLCIAALGNIIRYKKPGNRFAVNNKFTRSDKRVWQQAHLNISSVQTIFFVLIAIPMSIIEGVNSLLFLVCAVAAFVLFAYMWSYVIKNRIDQAAASSEDNDEND